MTLFNDYFAIAAEAIDGLFGEEFEVIPMGVPPAAPGGFQDVNARRTRDLSRDTFTFTGALTAPSGEFNAEGRRMSSSATTASNAPSLQIDASTTGWPYLPRRGDIVQRIETGARYTVSSELPPDDVGRTTIHLAERQSA